MENNDNLQIKINLSSEELLQTYIDSLSEKETKAYLIAKSHLTMSFTLEKSNGFLNWKIKNGYK